MPNTPSFFRRIAGKVIPFDLEVPGAVGGSWACFAMTAAAVHITNFFNYGCHKSNNNNQKECEGYSPTIVYIEIVGLAWSIAFILPLAVTHWKDKKNRNTQVKNKLEEVVVVGNEDDSEEQEEIVVKKGSDENTPPLPKKIANLSGFVAITGIVTTPGLPFYWITLPCSQLI